MGEDGMNGEASGTNGNVQDDEMEGIETTGPTSSKSDPRAPHANGESSTSGQNGNGGSSSGIKKKKIMEKRYFVGEQGVNVWREGMEVGNMITDGISACLLHLKPVSITRKKQANSLYKIADLGPVAVHSI